jgi:chromatin modification-related protein VID21
MTEVGPTDLSRLLQSKRNEYSSIVTGRKRKLRELFAVATHVDTLPQETFANPDAPTSSSAEWNFLDASDILQYVNLSE